MKDPKEPIAAPLGELLAKAQSQADVEDNAGAQHLIDQALALADGAQASGPDLTRVHLLAALLADRRGDLGMSARHATAANATAQALGDQVLQAHAQVAQARLSLAVGDHENSLVMLEAIWPLARDGQDLTLRFWCQCLLGIAHKDIGQFEVAIDWFRQAQATADHLGLERLQVLTAANLTGPWLDIGDRAFAQGDLEAARQAWQTAVQAADDAWPQVQESQSTRWQSTVAINRSAALVGLQRDDEARTELARAGQLASTAGQVGDQVLVALYTARLLKRRGELDAAAAEAARGLQLGEAHQARTALIGLYDEASLIEEARGQLALALAHSRRLHALHLESATDLAASRSLLLGIRLSTEQALAEAATERERTQSLQSENRALERRAESLGREALQDPLTGLANRRRLDLFLAQAHAEARACMLPLCVAMVDLDHFKSINDSFSHAVGDRVLTQVGALLRAACRDGDLPARYGGEEFAVVINNVDSVRALEVAERLRRSIECFDWGSVAPGLRVTASIGVCNVADAAEPAHGLEQADALLYQAKRAGRNRVVSRP